MKRQPKPTYAIPAEQAWAAAQAAFRINGNRYIKINDGENARPNKEIMLEILTQTPEQMVDQDHELASACRQRLGSEISLRLLKGQELGEWHTIQARICQLETVTTAYDLAVLASFPNSYNKTLARDQVKDRLRECEDVSVGAGRVNLSVEVVDCFYSKQWDCWYTRAIDQANRAVTFAYREQVKPGTNMDIVGTVKGFDNRISRLNRVRVLEQEAVA